MFVLILVLALSVLLLTIEILLKLILKVHRPVLFQTDAKTGYIFQPDQKISRFCKRNEYNQYSQRSQEICYEKNPKNYRILMLGDSVLNGGSYTDQSQTITAFLEDKLLSQKTGIEVLNASCSSWGIGNQLGYLQKFGTFHSDLIILQIGSHDLLQLTSTSDAVGGLSHPTRTPYSASLFLIRRLLLPKVIRTLKNEPYSALAQVPMPEDKQSQFAKNMEYLKEEIKLVQKANILIYVLFTPNREDLLPEFSNPPFKIIFLQILNELQIPIIDIHLLWSKLSPAAVSSYFRDDVHLYKEANLSIATEVGKVLSQDKQVSNSII